MQVIMQNSVRPANAAICSPFSILRYSRPGRQKKQPRRCWTQRTESPYAR